VIGAHRPRFDLWDRLRSLRPDANLDVSDLLSLGIEAVDDLLVCRRLLLSYGVEPIHLADRQADWSAFARDWVKKNGAAGHLAIVVTGPSEQDPGANSRMELLEL
jgi:hypothetical protein